MARGQQGASRPDAKLRQAVPPGSEGVAAAFDENFNRL